MGLFTRSQPNGWPEAGRDWIDTSTMAERLRFVQNYLMDVNDPLKQVDYGSGGAANESDPVAILNTAAANAEISDIRDPEEVSRFFSQLLYPSEGFANLDLDIDECIALLNSDAAGTPNNPAFDQLAVAVAGVRSEGSRPRRSSACKSAFSRAMSKEPFL